MIPLVSIITPTYNHEKYILECIDSVISQTFSEWEMIIVNDGSTDSTLQLIVEKAKEDSRILVFDQKNIGIYRLGETYNFALGKSRGKYISILEGDDLWESDKLERQVKALENNSEIVLAWGKASSVNADTGEVYGLHPVIVESDLLFNKPTGNILNLIYIENCLPALTITIRKDALLKVGGFIQKPNLPLVDLPTLLELSLLGEFYYDNVLMGSWRIYANQVTKTYTVEIIKGRYNVALEHMKKYPNIIKNQLNLNEKTFHNYFDHRIMKGYAMSGRYKLIRKDFSNARKDYIKSVFYIGVFNPIWRLRALVGLIFSFFKMDVEGLSKILGKKSYTR